MLPTRVCDLLGIEHPIVQSPMRWPVSPQLTAAVSNAGGLGICSTHAMSEYETTDPREFSERQRLTIREVRKLTDKPIGVIIRCKVANPERKGLDKYGPEELAVMEVALEEEVPIAYTTLGNPDAMVERLHKAGMKVMHIGTQVRHAEKVEESGCDAFVCAGYEAGGHSPGHGDTTIFTLLPQVVDAVKIPVLAGAGVGDARSFVAAFALGAEGVSMGTRFTATHESRFHQTVKDAMVNAGDTATVAWGKTLGTGLGRTMKNKFTEGYLDREIHGASAGELHAFIGGYQDPNGKGYERKTGGYFAADLEWGEIYMGAVVGLIREIKHAGDVVTDMVRDAEKVLARLNANSVPTR